jgi:ubiquinone/menaquinone biosynthesis C-methylase UbiE
MSIKEFFLGEWSGVANAWRRWEREARAQSSHATAWILELADVGAGMRVLDLASGVGDPALEAARRVGPGGHVVATDLVAGALSFVEDSARAEGLTWLTTATADMEHLPFADATFDAVTCRLGIMFCPRPDVALAEARRILKPGGRAAFVAWGRRDQPLFSATLGALVEGSSRPAEPTPVGMAGPFRFETEGSLAAELERAGFSEVLEEQRQIPWPFVGSAEQFWEMFCDLAGPSFRQTMSRLPAARRDDIARCVVRNLNRFHDGAVIDPTAVVVGCSGRAGPAINVATR